MEPPTSRFLHLLKDRIKLRDVPFSDRGSRLLIYQSNNHLTIRLAERWFKRGGQLSAYRNRPPLIDKWRFTDSDGNPLDLDLTTYPDHIECATRIGTFTLTFVDTETLLITLPATQCVLEFNANLDKIQTDERGGVLRLTGDIRRNVAYTTNARIVSHVVTPEGTENQAIHMHLDASDGAKSLLLNITPRLGFNRYIPDPEQVIKVAMRRWHEWFAAAPPVSEVYEPQYYYAWWVMRSGLISPRYFMTREGMTPSMIHYVGVWQWDACFHALAYRHIDMRLAEDQLRLVLDHQREDGMIPDAIHDEGIVTHLEVPVDADVTKPPLIAWTALKLYEQSRDREFLNEIYESLCRATLWWFEKSDDDKNGLCQYNHPFSSGLDDSPLWDYGMPVESPDINTYLYWQQESLSLIADIIGEKDDVVIWQDRAKVLLQRMIDIMWNESDGMFWALRQDQDLKKHPIKVWTPFSLYPLLTGKLSHSMASRLVEHLTDPNLFWTRYPIATVSRSESKYDPMQMWRGPTWVNINYLFCEGLERAGWGQLAAELRHLTLDLVMQSDDVYEYFHPETGERPIKAARLYGWTSAVFIDLAIRVSQAREMRA